MLLYSIVPYEKIFESTPTAPEMKAISGGYVELSRSDAGLEVTRVFSTDPRVYLDRKYALGTIFHTGR